MRFVSRFFRLASGQSTPGSDSPSSGLLLVAVSLVFAMVRRLAGKVVPGPRVFDEEKQEGFDRGEYDMSACHVTQ